MILTAWNETYSMKWNQEHMNIQACGTHWVRPAQRWWWFCCCWQCRCTGHCHWGRRYWSAESHRVTGSSLGWLLECPRSLPPCEHKIFILAFLNRSKISRTPIYIYILYFLYINVDYWVWFCPFPLMDTPQSSFPPTMTRTAGWSSSGMWGRDTPQDRVCLTMWH